LLTPSPAVANGRRTAPVAGTPATRSARSGRR